MKPRTNTAAKAGDAMPTYNDFEPLCGWRREEGKETLVVHVPAEFKSDQMKVHLSNCGTTLRIIGERPIDGTKLRRHFEKEIKVPKDCNTNKITAKYFTNGGLLHIIMPKYFTNTSVEFETKYDQPIKVVPYQQAMDWKVVMGVALVVVVVVVVALGAFATYNCTRPVSNV